MALTTMKNSGRLSKLDTPYTDALARLGGLGGTGGRWTGGALGGAMSKGSLGLPTGYGSPSGENGTGDTSGESSGGSASGGTGKGFSFLGSWGQYFTPHPELAGKTVSAGGMNITYDNHGMPSWGVNYRHEAFAGTDRSIRAPAIDGDENGLSQADQANIKVFQDAWGRAKADYDDAVARGDAAAMQDAQSRMDLAHEQAEAVRNQYGFTGGDDGSGYSKLPYYIFNPDNAATNPLSGRFGEGATPTTNWTTQRNYWGDDYYQNGIHDGSKPTYLSALDRERKAWDDWVASGGKPNGIFERVTKDDGRIRKPAGGGELEKFSEEDVIRNNDPKDDPKDGGTGGSGGGSGGGTGDAVKRPTGDPGRSTVDELLEEYRRLYGDDWQKMSDEEKAALLAATERTVNELNGQKDALDASYRDLGRQAYVNRMQSQRDLAQLLAAQGINGGAAESTRLGLDTAYGDALRRMEQGRLGELADIDRAITDARYRGDQSVAEAQAQALRERQAAREAILRNLIARYDQQEAQQWSRDYQTGRDRINDARYLDELLWNRNYQTERDRINDARYADELAWSRDQAAQQQAWQRQQWQAQQDQAAWSRAQQEAQWQAQQDQTTWSREQQERSYAYNYAMQLIGSGVMPDEATLAAAGMTAEQAQALMPQTGGYTPTFSQAQVLDAANRGKLTGQLLRDYIYYVYGDPDYNGG